MDIHENKKGDLAAKPQAGASDHEHGFLNPLVPHQLGWNRPRFSINGHQSIHYRVLESQNAENAAHTADFGCFRDPC